MKTIESIYMESTKWKIIHQYKGRKVLGTVHYYDQSEVRNELTEDQIKKIFERGLDQIVKTKKGKEKQQEYLIYSKEFRQGVVIDFRDFDLEGFEDGNNNMVVITFLPRTKSRPANPRTVRLMVEHKIVGELSDEFIEYVMDVFNIEESTITETINESDLVGIYKETFGKRTIHVVVSDGKLWDMTIPIIEVE